LRARAIALLAAAAVSVGACGNDAGNTATTTAGGAAAAPATSTAPPSGKTSSLNVTTDLSTKPTISKASGDPPKKLVVMDVVDGKGRAAKAGDSVVVHYVGVLYKTGKQFDASWDGGRPFPFALGQGSVIPGWDQGLQGMKVGGRRLLIIPPDLAYGAQGQGSIGPNETLVFVVDLLNDTPA
jgi:peptidylprolyl isomerase